MNVNAIGHSMYKAGDVIPQSELQRMANNPLPANFIEYTKAVKDSLKGSQSKLEQHVKDSDLAMVLNKELAYKSLDYMG